MTSFSRSLGSSHSQGSSRFSRTAPAPIQSFAEFQASRAERLSEVTADLNARRQQDVRDLQLKLQDLTMQLSATRSAMQDDERNFINQREMLVTQLHHIKTDADIRFSKEQLSFMHDCERLQREHDQRFREITKAMPSHLEAGAVKDNDELSKSKSQLKRLENSVRNFEQRSIERAADDEEERDHEECRQMYADRVTDLEDQKRELMQAIRVDERSNDDRMSELYAMMEEQDNKFRIEREEMSEKLARKEQKYKETIDKLYSDLERIQDQRMETMASRKERVEELQSQIDKVEMEMKQKLREASKVTEKLKVALANSNMRMSHQMEVERRRAREQQELMRDAFVLQQSVYGTEKRLERAKEEGSLLRRELSAKIGPRRTASLFL